MVVVPLLSEVLVGIDRQILGWHLAGPRLVFQISSIAPRPCCPRCHSPRVRRHGRYWRRPSDLPSLGAPVTLDIEVRRWRCTAPDCGGHTFSQSMGLFAGPRSRYSQRSREALQHLGCALGGQAAARLSLALGLRAGADTILLAVQALPLPGVGEPVVVGIDDWALARGHHYGTIFVDLQQHRPLDLIAGREMKEVRDWLARHPGIRVVARDRAGAYGQAARQALPQAVQVTDRWHLLSNLGEMAERVLLGSHQALRTATSTVNAELEPPSDVAVEPAAPSTPRSEPVAATRSAQRRALRLARLEEVRRRHGQAQAVRAIARDMGLAANTVRKFVHADGFPECSRRSPRQSLLDPWRAVLEARWMAGCRNAAQLWREIQAQGYRGGASQVRQLFSVRRQYPAGTGPSPMSRQDMHRTTPSARRIRARIFGCTRAHNHDSAQDRLWWRRSLDELCRIAPDVERMRNLGRQFIDIVRKHRAQTLPGWLEQAQASAVAPLQRFASGIESDQQAVIAALSTPWSSGQVEGQINRLKYLKRQMYGRAGLALLRIRVLHQG